MNQTTGTDRFYGSTLDIAASVQAAWEAEQSAKRVGRVCGCNDAHICDACVVEHYLRKGYTRERAEQVVADAATLDEALRAGHQRNMREALSGRPSRMPPCITDETRSLRVTCKAVGR